MRPPLPEVVVLVAGLAVAAASGVLAYRSAGLYGDGAFAMGYFRTTDPQTGASVMVRDTHTATGTVRRVFNNGLQVTSIRVAAGGRTEEIRLQSDKIAGVGFSLANDGVIDAWAYRDANNQLQRVEVSTKRNGKIDRWEYYKDNRLVRVELDTNDNGRPDKWEVYEDGILMETVIDANEDGKPDGRPIR